MSMSGARVLVTGASGFLGGHVVPELRRHGYEVFAAGRNEHALELVADDGHRVLGDLASLRTQDLPVDLSLIHI